MYVNFILGVYLIYKSIIVIKEIGCRFPREQVEEWPPLSIQNANLPIAVDADFDNID